MDPSTSPLEDFYHYVNGGWLKRNSIPSHGSRWSNVDEIQARTGVVFKRIIENAAKTSGDLLGDIFNSGMDERAIEESGLQGISDLFVGVERINNVDDVLNFLGTLHSEGIYAFFNLNSYPDSRNAIQVLAHLSPAALGLPSLEYYFSQKEKFREPYLKHIQNMFTLANVKFPANSALNVYFVEKLLASYSKKPNEEELKYTYTELQTLSSINWDGYFTNLGLTPNSFGDIVSNNDHFFTSLPGIFEQFDLPEIKDYLKWFILRNTYKCLPKPFQEEGSNFFDLILKGQQQPTPRGNVVLDVITSWLGDELSKRFVQEVFPPQAKKEALDMVEFLRDALKEIIEKLDWMEESTKEKALEKLYKLRVKIGYPDQWEDYSDININSNDSFLHNIRQLMRRKNKKKLDDINKKVKEWQWSMPSYVVNSYYIPKRNEIVFPATIFQPPFFFSNGDFNVEDMAFNFGGIGTIIGHEITHGYDNRGRKYDSNGNYANWWTVRDSKLFEEKASTIIDQFDELQFYGQSIDGYKTQGENIADLGGVKISYHAFQNWMKQNGEPKDLHGFSPNQQFFIAYAQTWRTLTTKEQALLELEIDPHSPAIHRVNQPLSNMQEFYDAFGEPNSTQGMYREKEKRVQIW